MTDNKPKENGNIKQSDSKLSESWDFTSQEIIEKRNNDLNRYNITAQETNPAFDSFFDSKGEKTQKN